MKKLKTRKTGGRYVVECPNCGERDIRQMTTGQRAGYVECHCGFSFDADTGQGRMRNATEDQNS